MDIRDYRMACREVPAVKCKNAHQKAVFTNAYFAACDIVGGIENTLLDYPEDHEEYKNAQEFLNDYDTLYHYVFHEATHGEYGCGFAGPGTDAQKHYRFAGKQFTLDCVTEILKAMGYPRKEG